MHPEQYTSMIVGSLLIMLELSIFKTIIEINSIHFLNSYWVNIITIHSVLAGALPAVFFIIDKVCVM
jgi:hypothetical protein